MAHIVTDQNFRSDILNFKGIALVDFWAPWCGPCRVQGPVVEELAQQFTAQTNVVIGKMNVDENPEVSQQYQILSIPTLKIFKDGELVADFVGVQSKEVLEHKIKSLI